MMAKYPKTPHTRLTREEIEEEVDETKKSKAVTPLLFASMKGEKDDVLQKLLVEGMNVNQSQGDGWTALHYSVNAGHQDVINLLAVWGADMNCKTLRSHSTPLHLAAKRGNVTIVENLVDLGANPSALDAHGWTPMQLAETCGHQHIARLLRMKAKMMQETVLRQKPCFEQPVSSRESHMEHCQASSPETDLAGAGDRSERCQDYPSELVSPPRLVRQRNDLPEARKLSSDVAKAKVQCQRQLEALVSRVEEQYEQMQQARTRLDHDACDSPLRAVASPTAKAGDLSSQLGRKKADVKSEKASAFRQPFSRLNQNDVNRRGIPGPSKQGSERAIPPSNQSLAKPTAARDVSSAQEPQEPAVTLYCRPPSQRASCQPRTHDPPPSRRRPTSSPATASRLPRYRDQPTTSPPPLNRSRSVNAWPPASRASLAASPRTGLQVAQAPLTTQSQQQFSAISCSKPSRAGRQLAPFVNLNLKTNCQSGTDGRNLNRGDRDPEAPPLLPRLQALAHPGPPVPPMPPGATSELEVDTGDHVTPRPPRNHALSNRHTARARASDSLSSRGPAAAMPRAAGHPQAREPLTAACNLKAGPGSRLTTGIGLAAARAQTSGSAGLGGNLKRDLPVSASSGLPVNGAWPAASAAVRELERAGGRHVGVPAEAAVRYSAAVPGKREAHGGVAGGRSVKRGIPRLYQPHAHDLLTHSRTVA